MSTGSTLPPGAPGSEPRVAPSRVTRWYRRIRRLGRRIRRAVRHEVHTYYRGKPVEPDTVFYESFAGSGVLCNPEAIFRGLLAAPDFGHLRHVWALRSLHANHAIVREFAHDSRVSFVRVGSRGYLRALARSGWLINNATFPSEFSKRDGQTYLNTWHGTPLKKMGYDIGEPASRVANVIRNFLQADYLLAANHFMLDQMYEKGYALSNIFRGKIVEEGYPRIDNQFRQEGERDDIRRTLATAAGVDLDGRKIILYAPTWKGTNFSNPADDIDELASRVEELRRGVDETRYVVLLKTHQVVHRYASDRPSLSAGLVPNELPTNTILAVTDLLITDYSSIFFDFLPTRRPIVFYAPDIADYRKYRGLYLDTTEWPGPLVTSIPELIESLRSIDAHGVGDGVRERYESMLARFAGNEDGHATDRVIDIVFRGITDGYRVRDAATDGRTSILIHAGGMRPNGITSSLTSLLSSVDHSKFDVTVIFPNSNRALIVAKQQELDPRVRQLARVGGMNGSKVTHLQRRVSWLRGNLGPHRTNERHRRLWDDEWTRCLGASRFDYVIDFSGYAPLFATLLLHSPAAERSIWLHNDMAADAHRVIRGRKRYLRGLRAVFSLYREYDHLVSVSPALSEINRKTLGQNADPSKFTSARNLIDGDQIRETASVPLVDAVTDQTTGEVPDWVSRLAPEAGRTTFVTVGRLSREKNQARLLDAFAATHRAHPRTQLVVVGSGPLEEALIHQARSLGMSDSVIFTGHQSNPYAIMKASDCFVLSSDYEGQPMVILEAGTLGKAVISVAFGSVADAMPAGAGLVVEQSAEGLTKGMNAFVEGAVHADPLDYVKYNRDAVAEFSRAIGIRDLPESV